MSDLTMSPVGWRLVVAAVLILGSGACRSDGAGLGQTQPPPDTTRETNGSGGARSGGTAGTGRRTGGAGGGTGGVPHNEREGDNSDAGSDMANEADTRLPAVSDATAGDKTSPEVDAPALPPDEAPMAKDAAAHDASADVSGQAAAPRIVVRANGITANIVRAKVIYAQSLDTYEAEIGRINRSNEESRWRQGEGLPHVTVHELVADEIFVKELNCRRVEADAVFAQEVEIQSR
jgi:hypothetical protein